MSGDLPPSPSSSPSSPSSPSLAGRVRGAAGRHRGAPRPGRPAPPAAGPVFASTVFARPVFASPVFARPVFARTVLAGTRAASPGLLAAAVVLLLVLPGLGLPRLTLNLGTEIVLFGLAATGLNLMLGYAGMLSLGGALYLGASGYVVGLTTQFWGWPLAGALLAAIAGSLLLALLLGLVLVGLSGHYFAVANLGLATALAALLVAFPQATGGTSGLTRARTLDLGVVTVSSDLGWYLTAVIAALIGLLVFGWTVAGKRGRILRLVRADQLAANVLGVRTYRTKLLVYVIAAFFPALAGALLFPFSGLVTPDAAGAVQSVQLVALIVVGGVGYRLGGFVGALVILWLQALVDTSGNWSLLIYAIVFLLVAFYAPGGLIGALQRGWRARGEWRTLSGPRPRHSAAPPPAGSPPAGSPPAGSPPAGSPPAGSPPAGSPPVGSPPAGSKAPAPAAAAAALRAANVSRGSAGESAPQRRAGRGTARVAGGGPAGPGQAGRGQAGATQAGLVVRGVAKRFGGVAAVRDVSLEVPPGNIVALIGSNGAGKSTLVNLISGIDRPDAGAVLLDGRDLTGLRAPERTRLGLARTFQVPRLVDELTVADNLVLGEEAAEPSFLRRSRAREARQRQLALARLAEGTLGELAGRRAGTLGTGERKFVELVRALIADPVVCLLDEPAVGLSLEEIAHLANWLRALRDSGAAVLVIDHNLDFIHGLADQVYVMDLGRIVKSGSAADLVGTREARASLLSSPASVGPAGAGQPGEGHPSGGHPSAGQPRIGHPGASSPDAGLPNLGQSNLGQSNLGQSNLGQPNPGQPNPGQPNTGHGRHARPWEGSSHGERD
jgi:ABC-type branched-subunit amino acid transport system ATPase component/ABC-type branched-subunit amino acid transport system permease subunit